MVIRYAPGPVPSTYQPDFIRQEFAAISAMLRLLADGEIEVSHAPPTRLKDGLVRLADGTDWDPGSGPGMYHYQNAAWHFMG